MTMIKVCTCKHEFQDKKYGFRKRVHNQCKKEGKIKGWRCTVCGNIKGE